MLLYFEFCIDFISIFMFQAPISEIWDNITVGMKVEVENTDCDEVCEAFPDSFWVATVLRISGYRALLRYEGFGLNDDKDFWVSLCSNDIHPVGWCATIGKPLIPPNSKQTFMMLTLLWIPLCFCTKFVIMNHNNPLQQLLISTKTGRIF